MSEVRKMFNGASFVASAPSPYESKGIWVCGGCGNGSFVIPVDRDEVCAKCQAIEVKKMRNFGGLPERNQMSGWSCNGCRSICSGVLSNDRGLCPKCMDKVDEMDLRMVFAREHLGLTLIQPACSTCRGKGTVDETLGGRGTSSSEAPCPDCRPYRLGDNPELERILDDANRQVESCECAKDKFGFEFHERWCPDWVHPFEAAAAMQAKLAAVPKPDYRTQGDKLRMGARK